MKTKQQIIDIISNEPDPDKVITELVVYIDDQKNEIQQLKEMMAELVERFEELETIAFANEHLPGPEPIVVKIRQVLFDSGMLRG